MNDEETLDTPEPLRAIYEALGRDDASEMTHRPAFTGDVYQLDDSLVCLVQHPCAMRRGTDLVEKVLACRVSDGRASMPSDWGSGSFKKSFLPELVGGEHRSVNFPELEVVPREILTPGRRVAVMSQLGVNILVQRWIYHNSRVAVRTITINQQVAPVFEEADLTMECVDDLVDGGWAADTAYSQVNTWFRNEGGALQAQLHDSQARSGVRRQMRSMVKQALEDKD